MIRFFKFTFTTKITTINACKACIYEYIKVKRSVMHIVYTERIPKFPMSKQVMTIIIHEHDNNDTYNYPF